MRRLLPLLLLTLAPAAAHAGLYYSGEEFEELPSRWRGFLLDHRALRQIAARPTKASPATALRERYAKEAARLAKKDTLTADEAADLGALHVRLGEPTKAVEVLGAAQKQHPEHFRIAANLGTAWQAAGELSQASAALEQAVRLAPGKHLAAEKLHLRLVRLREREKAGTQTLDDLFGVRYLGPKGEYTPGHISEEGRKKLPAAAAALTQQLALWLPDDPRLLWQLAELANAHGDAATAAAIMDGCVTEFGMRDADLLEHRKSLRDAAKEPAQSQAAKEKHEKHEMPFLPRSARPLAAKDLTDLPPIDPKKPNPLAWEVIGRTAVGKDGRPTFPKYLKDLDNLTVVMSGHMQPVQDEGLGAFLLIEHPVGCWYCEMPDLQWMVMVEMPRGKSAQFTRDRVTVTGRLKLNAKDPERFLYFLEDATVQ